MLTANDLEAITAPEVVYDIARSLDPLAFDNSNMQDREDRRAAVYTRIEIAYKDFQIRERGLGWIRPQFLDMEIEW